MLVGAALLKPAPAIAVTAARVVVLDWAIAETLVTLGIPMQGAAEIPNYDRTVVAPLIPASVVDVGLRLAPNPEVMRLLAPDLILINPDQAYLRPSLVPFGAVQTVPIYLGKGQPYDEAWEAAEALSHQFGATAALDGLRARADSIIAATKQQIAGYDGRPLTIVSFIDDRHVSLFGGHSLFEGVLKTLGLTNAWSSVTGPWGATTVGIETLTAEPKTRLLYFGPIPPEARQTFAQSSLWRSLPFVRAHRVVELPPLWAYGGVPSALRFAQMLGPALSMESGHG